MVALAKTLLGLAAVAFVLAVVTNFTGGFLTASEGWSRAATNLAVFAIALAVVFRSEVSAAR